MINNIYVNKCLFCMSHGKCFYCPSTFLCFKFLLEFTKQEKRTNLTFM